VRMWTGRAFQEAGPACENARSPNFVVRTVLYFKKNSATSIHILTSVNSACHRYRSFDHSLPTLAFQITSCGSRVVSMLDSGAEGPVFKSQPRRCRVTVLGKLFTPIVPLHKAAKLLVAALLRVARVTADLAESNGSLSPVYDSRHLRADCQVPGSAPEPYARQSSMGYLHFFI